MTVKLSLLKSGEDVIADVQEMVIEDRVVGYFFNNPCIVKVIAKNFDPDDNESQSKTPCQLQLTSWIPLTNDERVPVPPDWIVTMVEPITQLKEMYEKGILKNDKNDQDSGTSEQSDSNQSD